MQQFKESVLGDDGLSVRAMSDDSAKELADQAATGLLDLVSATSLSSTLAAYLLEQQ